MRNHPLLTDADKRTIMRAVYHLKNARMQDTEIRIRCVTVAPADVAQGFAETFFDHDKLGNSIQFLCWDDDRYAFAGRMLDMILLSGMGDYKRIAECWARLRDPVKGTPFEKWGRSLEIMA